MRLTGFALNAVACIRAAGLRWLRQGDLEALFDRGFYLKCHPDVARSGIDPLAHYLLYGAAEHRQPHPLFDAAAYLADNPDVARSGWNPLLHFLRHGWKEQRRPNALFDAGWYREQHPEIEPDRNPFLDYVRRRGAGERVAAAPDWSEYLPSPDAGARVSAPGVPIDVIIPVYGGLEETRACLESVVRSRSHTPANVVVVNDASPEPDLADWLRTYAAQHDITLIENAANLGYARSVNRAMELHPDHDVVLLNNDTEVAGDWLDRLAAAAWSKARICTATPFSNEGTICTCPFPADGTSVKKLDDVFRAVNHGRRVLIPTAVGFCMYIRRDCLRETGGFDEHSFGKGYGEENDFSMRAAGRGWRHVLAADVFVYHAGEVSFGAEAATRRAEAQAVLRRKHPDYHDLVGRHARRDPAQPYRFAASAWRLRHSLKPVILAISHSLGGGVEQHVSELRDVSAAKAEMLLLTPLAAGLVMLRNPDPANEFRIVLDTADHDGVVAVLRSCGVARVHVHHLMGHVMDVAKLCRDLDVPFDFTAHDYYAVCPQVKLADPAGRYCGEPDEAGCNRCLAERPHDSAINIASWRDRHRWLGEAERVIAPSVDTAVRLARYFPHSNIVAASHSEPPPASVSAPRIGADAPLRIAAIGVMTREKGLDNLATCAERAARRHLPLEFFLAGDVERGLPRRHAFLQTGPYENGRVTELLRSLGANVVWYPAVWPETFSYALNACLEAQLPVVAPAIGAFPERLAGRPWSWLMPWSTTPGDYLEFFLGIREQNFCNGVAPDPPVADIAGKARSEFYPREYLAPLAPRTVAAAGSKAAGVDF